MTGPNEPVPVEIEAVPVEIEPVRPPSMRRRLLLGLVAFAVVLALALGEALRGPGPRPGPDPAEPTPGASRATVVASGDRIALIAPDGGLSIVDRSGALIRRLPGDATAFRFPAFSPDGDSLAAIGASPDSSSVVVFDVQPGLADGDAQAGSSRTVFSSPDRGVIYLSWAPGSRQIGFLTGGPEALALRVGPADGARDAEIVLEGQPLYWDWLDASSLLVHGGGTGAGAFVEELPIDGSAPVERATLPGIFQAPAVSADGRHVAFVVGRPGVAGSLVVAERDGSSRTALVEVRAAAFGWNPARAELAFIDGGGAAGPSLGPLRIGDAASGAIRTVLDAAVAAFFWSPDGASIAALTLEPADGGNIASATGSGGADRAAIPGFHVRLVVVDAVNGAAGVERIVALSELFEQQLLPFFDQYAKSHRLWSADSRAVVLPLVDAEGAAHLTVIPIDGGPEVDVGPGVLGFWSP